MADSGLVIIDKGAGLTSHDVVARVRRLAGTRKVGHAGTLDPMATGVLVVGVERATRLLGHLMLTDKTYTATVRLGETTHTDDAEGDLLVRADGAAVAALTEEQIRAAFATQVGEIQQVPTAVSAIKVDGKRAYALVREGVDVQLKARAVTIHELTVHAVRPAPADAPGVTDVDITVRCTSGTYIRAIARDVGALLGVGGHLTALRRTAVGPYTVVQAHSIEELQESYVQLPIADAARAAFPSVELSAEQAADVRLGRKLTLDLAALSALFAPTGEFLALYEPISGGRAKALAVFV
ncbi:tRNA pseudouridine(55) synthase TruB [Nocardioides sp.]|uniref:tRNA pseudouridine(55) synthase TruB n=1 Tax=Nocardioides sp. TaxID=35761 RepID=UPI00261DB257|nr:tRNA pseudouridine(55) synthase TruB [Nocardioides sp.]